MADYDPRDMCDMLDRSDTDAFLSSMPPIYVVDDDGNEVLLGWDARCTAITARERRRCKNAVLGGHDLYQWPTDEPERGPLRFTDPGALARVVALLCAVHLNRAKLEASA